MPVRNEVVLPKRVVPQPTPNIFASGDCGACVLGGLLGMTPAEVYPFFEFDPKEDINFQKMRQAIYHREKFDRRITNFPEWPQSFEAMRTYGNPARNQSMAWFEYVRMGLDGGYYAIANVDHSKRGMSPDHWVLICGAREVFPEEQGVIEQQVLVSCSSRSTPDEEWVNVRDFLTERGGFNCYLARPAAR